MSGPPCSSSNSLKVLEAHAGGMWSCQDQHIAFGNASQESVTSSPKLSPGMLVDVEDVYCRGGHVESGVQGSSCGKLPPVNGAEGSSNNGQKTTSFAPGATADVGAMVVRPISTEIPTDVLDCQEVNGLGVHPVLEDVRLVVTQPMFQLKPLSLLARRLEGGALLTG